MASEAALTVLFIFKEELLCDPYLRTTKMGMDVIVSYPKTSGGRQPRSESSMECFPSLLSFLYLYVLPVSIGR